MSWATLAPMRRSTGTGALGSGVSGMAVILRIATHICKDTPNAVAIFPDLVHTSGMPTAIRHAADMLTPGGLDAFVAARRPGTSWRNIARDLERTTGGKVVLAPETLRLWYPDLRARAAA